MIKESVTIDETIALLNEILTLDSTSAHALVEDRWRCNEAITEHPPIRVSQEQPGAAHVGILGVLNGIFGVDDAGWGPISVVFEADGHISRFERTARTLPKPSKLVKDWSIEAYKAWKRKNDPAP